MKNIKLEISKNEIQKLRFFVNAMHNTLVDEEEGLLYDSEKLTQDDKDILDILEKIISSIEETQNE